MAFLLIRTITRRGEEQTVTQEAAGPLLRIGRGTDNELHLDDFAVSYSHATIALAEGRYVLRDLTGAGLTLLNHQPVQQAEVRDGDQLRIGPYQLRLSLPAPHGPLTVQIEEEKGKTEEAKVALFARYSLSTSPWRKRVLSLAACLLVLGASVLAYGLGKYKVFMPGNVSLKHSLFANDCLKCHAGWKAVWDPVPDKACLVCHAGPPHFRDRSLTATPHCASCHVEHKGKTMLALVPDAGCAACHGELQVKGGDPHFALSIHSFTKNHPEFAISLPGIEGKLPHRIRLDAGSELQDHAQLKLNHKLHLAPDLAGPAGPEQLSCGSCHTPDTRGAYMLPISYQRDCMRCHLLDFDERLGPKTVPHPQKPEEVRHFLQAAYAEYYLLTHEAELKGRPMVKRLPGAVPTKEEAWVGDMSAKAEQYLYSKKTKKCLLCHTVEFPAGRSQPSMIPNIPLTAARPLPEIAKTAVPIRWLPNSMFNHAPHNDLIKRQGCTACHAGAEKSERTSDVLLPGINSCRMCHFEPGGARADCIECHAYHDKTMTRVSEHPIDLRPSPSPGEMRQTEQ